MKTSLISIFILTSITFSIHSQEVFIKGRIVDFETGNPIEAVSIYEENTINGTVSDSLGLFQLQTTSECESKVIILSFVGYYQIKLRNIYSFNDTIEFHDLKMVWDYSNYVHVEMAPDIEPDLIKYSEMKKKIEDNYRINLDNKSFSPQIIENSIVFILECY